MMIGNLSDFLSLFISRQDAKAQRKQETLCAFAPWRV